MRLWTNEMILSFQADSSGKYFINRKLCFQPFVNKPRFSFSHRSLFCVQRIEMAASTTTSLFTTDACVCSRWLFQTTVKAQTRWKLFVGLLLLKTQFLWHDDNFHLIKHKCPLSAVWAMNSDEDERGWLAKIVVEIPPARVHRPQFISRVYFLDDEIVD